MTKNTIKYYLNILLLTKKKIGVPINVRKKSSFCYKFSNLKVYFEIKLFMLYIKIVLKRKFSQLLSYIFSILFFTIVYQQIKL